MLVIIIDFIVIIGSIVGAILSFNKDWVHFFILVILAIHSISNLSTHFRRKFIDKWRN